MEDKTKILISGYGQSHRQIMEDLLKSIDQYKIMESALPPIDSFEGETRWASNFWPAPVTYEDLTYPTVEHAFQAAKTLDKEERMMICCLPTPGQAKRAGGRRAGKIHLRADWEHIKLQVMEDLVRQKFTRYPVLAAKLLATGDRKLIEGNNWGDDFWGVPKGKPGKNHLGLILMKVRQELKGV